MKRALIMMLGVVTGLTGCMGESYLFDEEFGGDSGSLWHTGMDSGDSGQIEDPDPVWFALDAEVEMVDGAVSEVVVSLRLHPEDPEDGAICTDTPKVSYFEEEAVPDPLVYHWIEVGLGEDAGSCDGAARVPRTMMFGLGQLYEPIVPGVEEHGLGDVRDSLYGAYASFEAPVGDGLAGTTYGYGYAGTEADREGATTAVADGPLPDGRYLVTAWYVFELLP
ncbi:MAG TPA: hypothetical protein QGF58_07470 [Myxococcota bacterium]|nr:hypothetical protein [Myxococcota bacterium]